MRNFIGLAGAAVWAVALYVSPVSACECEGEKAVGTQGKKKEMKTEKSSATCGCSSAGDCTCKKGSCQCSKCGAHPLKVMEPLNQEKTGSVELPEGVKLDASAGFFI